MAPPGLLLVFLVAVVASVLGAHQHGHEVLHAVREHPQVYDLEAASALRDTGRNVHRMAALMEGSEDDGANIRAMTAFLELQVVAGGDVDDGGPEDSVLHITSHSAHEAEGGMSPVHVPEPVLPKTMTLGYADPHKAKVGGVGAPKGSDLFPRKLPAGAAARQHSHLPPGAGALVQTGASTTKPTLEETTDNYRQSFSSSVQPTFSDDTANLALLIDTMTQTKAELTALKNFVRRRLRCRVDPAACDPLKNMPNRTDIPKTKCDRRYKYLCRTTYELTPGASQSSSGGTAPQKGQRAAAGSGALLLIQPNQGQTILPPINLDDDQHAPSSRLGESTERERHLEHLLQQQTAVMSRQGDPFKHVRSDHRRVRTDDPVQNEAASHVTLDAPVRGRTKSTFRPNKPHHRSISSSGTVEADTSPKVQAVKSVDPPRSDGHPQAPAAAAPAAPPAQDVVPAEHPAGNDGPHADEAELARLRDENARLRAELDSVHTPSSPATGMATPPKPAAATTTTPHAESLGVSNALQVEHATQDDASVSWADASGHVHMSAQEQARVKGERAAQEDRVKAINLTPPGTHNQAQQWASKLLANQQRPHGPGVFVPSHIRHEQELQSLVELEEGSGPENGMPDDDFIHHLAEHEFETVMHRPADDVQNLLEVEEGHGSAEQETGVGQRKCAKRLGRMCEIFKDGSRCIQTDTDHALCGFTAPKKATGRVYTVVEMSDLL